MPIISSRSQTGILTTFSKKALLPHMVKMQRRSRHFLDVDTLKASKNQKEDIAAAIKGLSEAEDSKMLFERRSLSQPERVIQSAE